MITCFKFKDIIDITYYSNDDCLYLSLSDKYLQEHSPFKNSKDYMLEYEKRTTDNPDDLENNIVSVILKLYHDEDFCYISGCYIEHFINKFNKKTGINYYDWDSFLRIFRKQPLLKFAKLIIDNSDCEQRSRANNIKDEYDIISFLYLMCKNPDFATLENAGFKFVNMTGDG